MRISDWSSDVCSSDLMEAEAKRVGEELGLAWIRPIASNYTHSAAAGLYRVILPQPDLTEEQLARLEAIAQRQEVIAGEMDDESIAEDAYKALDQEYDVLAEEEHTIPNIPHVLTAGVRPEEQPDELQ